MEEATITPYCDGPLRPFCDGTHKIVRFRAPSEAEDGRDARPDSSPPVAAA